ncbi:MAG: DUF2764 domain-containing protein [Methanolinea sp.]|nr:DUF2764 domain-containing protein [Methanolinea sp.]
MADFYPYLIASLPMLHFGEKPPFSFERFLEQCRQFIPRQDFQLIAALPVAVQFSETGTMHGVIRKYIEFEVALRNELVRLRAPRRSADPSVYLRTSPRIGTSILPPGIGTMGDLAILEDEKKLDETRWKALDEMAIGHSFDLPLLITYAYKLLILERWEKIRNADTAILLDQALGSGTRDQ